MYDRSELGYLIRKIKRTYKWYTGERTDGTATIFDLAQLFKLPINMENLEDYEVKSFDSKIPSIEIISKKDNSTYFAAYSAACELLSYSGCEVKFINQTITYPDGITYQNTCSIFYDKVYFEQISIPQKDGYILKLFREYPNNITFFRVDEVTTYITLSKEDGHSEPKFFITTLKTHYKEFEMQGFRNGDEEYQYKLNSGIIYSEHYAKHKSEDLYHILFCENVFAGLDNYLPLNFQIEKDIEIENKTLTNDQVYSVICFFTLPLKIYIYKECKNFKVKYIKTMWLEDEEIEYFIPVLNSCCPIEYLECEYLANELANYIKDEEVLKAICEKLDEIKFRLMVSKGLAQKKDSILNIEKYRDIDFDGAIKVFVENQDEIFEEILKKIE